jgi:hypothetical protein
MPVKIKTFLSALFAIGWLTACAQMSSHEAGRNTNIIKAEQDARTPDEHVALARHFEEAAKEMQLKANEQKKLLKRYEEKHYLYDRQPHELEAHTQALILKYEKTAKACAEAAAAHRKMASKAAELKK